METIEIKTLIDITNTNVRRSNQGTPQEHNQFRNWTTLLQSIGLRAIIDYDHNPIVEELDIAELGFGTEFKGIHRVWTFRFRPDRADAFVKNDSAIGLLIDDLDRVPVIPNLTETINTRQSVFNLMDSKFKNTVIKAL